MSWLGLEENADDPCKFTLTSRSTSGNIERYTLHSTSPGVSQVWVHQVSQILENQRNFLNGTTSPLPRLWSLKEMLKCYLQHVKCCPFSSSTALTSPIEYQRNHVGGSGSGGPPSGSSTGGLPGGSSSNTSSNMGGGGGGGSGGSGGNSSSLCGPRSRPSRIPQPSSRLPQPVHHHHQPLGPEGPDRSAGMWSPCHPHPHPSNPFSDSTTTNGDVVASEMRRVKMADNSHGNNSNNSNRSSGSSEGRQALGGNEETQKHKLAGIPQMAVAPLNLPPKNPKVGTVSPLISPQPPVGGVNGGKDSFVPSSPAHKGNTFWAMVPNIPPSHGSRPGSFSYPSDSNGGGGDSLGRGSHGTPSHHRHSTHSKDIDRMSTCSSTSEQSIQSTQSNGVRRFIRVRASLEVHSFSL